MNVICPKCHGTHTITKDTAKNYGGIVGTAGGAISGASSAWMGANIGSKVGMLGGAPGVAVGTIVGAVLGALLGGTTGGIAGSQIGHVFDEHVLNNYECQDCGHSFSRSEDSQASLKHIDLP